MFTCQGGKTLRPLWPFTLDTEGKVTDWNEAAERVFGWEAEEVFGRPNPIVPPEKGEEYRALQAQLLKSEQLPMLEVAGRRKDGSDITISLSSALLRDAGGRVNGSMAIITDLTDRKKLEHQLRQAQKMEAVGQLAGGVAHDFNNILSAIIGYAHLALMRMHEDDPLRHSQEQILASAERASHLTQSLLAFSRKQIINPKLINIGELTKRFEKFLRRLIREDIQLTIACGDSDLTVMADSGQIEQVLMNLAANANDAMPDTGRLTITADRVTLDEEFTRLHGYGKKGTYALITVADTGCGMDRKTQEKIFEPFFTTKEHGKGTGLGLSIAYGIVKQHDGFINVYSETGKGTIFKIYLPKVAAGSEEAAMTRASEALLAKGGNETVLIAEDDEPLRRLTTAMLGEFGYRVIQAEDGEDAINKFRENRETVRLLIVDTVMPKRNGKEVFDAIKSLNPRIKVLFTSGYPADIIHKKGILDKALPFIAKPFGPNELLRKVREALDS